MAFPLPKKTKNDPEKVAGKKYSFLALLFSVFAALVLWFYVQEAEAPDYKKTFSSVSVRVEELSSSFSVIGGGQITADITMIGKKSDLNRLKSSDLEVYLDLSSIKQPGYYSQEINVLVPEGTELSECFPKTAELFVDQTVSTSVPVRVELGPYTVGENIIVEAEPTVPQITVKGPKTVLDEIDCAKIITGDLGAIQSGFEANLEYVLYDSRGQAITSDYVPLSSPNVRVKFSVYKTKTVPFTVLCKNGWWNETQMQYSVNPKNVLIKGDPALIDTIVSVPALIVDETQFDDNQLSTVLTPAQLPLPAGVSLAETLGDVKVKLNLTDNVSRTLRMQLNSTHVVITSPGANLQYHFAEDAISFKIRGDSQSVNGADVNDFYLNIDLSGFSTPGEYEIPVQIVQTSASTGKYYPVGSHTVKVTLS